jgi:hypothetical protein
MRKKWRTCPKCRRKIIVFDGGTRVGLLHVEQIAPGAAVVDGRPVSGRLIDVMVACPRGHRSRVDDLFTFPD